MAAIIRGIYQFLRGGNEDAIPVPEDCLTLYKRMILGTLATATVFFILAGLAYADITSHYFMMNEFIFGCIVLLFIPFETYILYLTWAQLNRVAPYDSDSPERVQHPEGRLRRNYGTCNDEEQRDESANVEDGPQPSDESPGSPASPEVASTRGSNKDESDPSVLVTAEINNENLQKPDSETEAGSKQMECSTKSTETSTSAAEPSSETATEVAK